MGFLSDAEALVGQGPSTYDLEPTTKKLIKSQNDQLAAPSTDQLLKGVGNAGDGLLVPNQAYNYSTGLGGDSGAGGYNVLDAMRERNSKRSADYINTLKRELNLAQPARDAGRLKMVGQNLASQAEVTLNNNRILKQYDLDKRRLEQYKQQQKDSILGSILGVIGTIGGVALGAATGGVGGVALGLGTKLAGNAAAAYGGGKTPGDFTSEGTFGKGSGLSLFGGKT